jgi:hypothetical protein
MNHRAGKRLLIETAVHAGSFRPPYFAQDALSSARSTRKTCLRRLPVSIRACHSHAEMNSFQERKATWKRVEGVWGRGASSPPRTIFFVRRSRSELLNLSQANGNNPIGKEPS